MHTVLAQGASISLMIAIMSVGLFGIHVQYERRHQMTKTLFLFTSLLFASIVSVLAIISFSQTIYYHIDESLGSFVASRYFIFAPIIITCQLWLAAELYLKGKPQRILKVTSILFIIASVIATSFYDKEKVSLSQIGLLFPGQNPIDAWLYFLPIVLSSLILSILALREYLRHRKNIDLLGAISGPFSLIIPALNTMVITRLSGTPAISFLLSNLINNLILIIFFVAKTDPNPKVAKRPLYTFQKSIRLKINIFVTVTLFLLLSIISILTSLIFIKAYENRSLAEIAKNISSSAEILELNFQSMARESEYLTHLAVGTPEFFPDASNDPQLSVFLTDDDGNAFCDNCTKWPYAKNPKLGQTIDNFKDSTWVQSDSRVITNPTTGQTGILTLIMTIKPPAPSGDNHFQPTYSLLTTNKQLALSSRPVESDLLEEITRPKTENSAENQIHQLSSVPISNANGDTIGYYFGFETQDDQNRWTMLISLTLMEIGLLLGLTTVTLTWYGMKRFVNPVIILGRIAGKVGGGNYDVKVNEPKNPKDELDMTIIAFNQMTEAVKLRTSELQEKNREQRDFLNYVAHELKSPITAIQWTLEMAVEEAEGSETLEYVEEASKSAIRMRNLVTELLEFARLERNVIKIDPADITAETVIDEAVAEISSKSEMSSAKIQWNRPKQLPQVKADPKRLNQVLVNVIGNAVKYSTMDERAVVTVTASQSDNKHVLISVRDTGIGIPPDQQKKIFSKFFRADNAVESGIEGTGLGLHVSKRFIEMMKGKMWFESNPGEGTIFFISLPLA